MALQWETDRANSQYIDKSQCSPGMVSKEFTLGFSGSQFQVVIPNSHNTFSSLVQGHPRSSKLYILSPKRYGSYKAHLYHYVIHWQYRVLAFRTFKFISFSFVKMFASIVAMANLF